MEAPTVRAQTRLLSLLLLLPLCHSALLLAAPTLCQIPRLEDSILPHDGHCQLDHQTEFYEALLVPRGVLEVNGAALQRSLQLLNTRGRMHATVLVYARWCPFSRALVPVFDSLASTFPLMYHFAVEEASLHPSAYAYYGVSSFPVLFFHNKTAKVRYEGPRTYEALTRFYKEFSGFQPVVHQGESQGGLKLMQRGEPRLLSRALESRKFQDELYLILSVIFLATRLLFHLLPRVMKALKRHWAGKFRPRRAHCGASQRAVVCAFEKKRQPRKSTNGKSPKMDLTQETGKVLLSVPGWPSSSLAPVSLVEGGGSSKAGGAKDDVRDISPLFRSH